MSFTIGKMCDKQLSRRDRRAQTECRRSTVNQVAVTCDLAEITSAQIASFNGVGNLPSLMAVGKPTLHSTPHEQLTVHSKHTRKAAYPSRRTAAAFTAATLQVADRSFLLLI